MTTFIMTGKLSGEAVKLISAERTVKAKQIFQQCGGVMVDGYATLGGTDYLVIAEFPDVGEAMKASVELHKALGIAWTTVPALRIDEFDELFSGRP